MPVDPLPPHTRALPNPKGRDMSDLWKLTALEAVDLLKKGEISPLDMVEASAARIESSP